MKPTQQLHDLGQRPWFDNITRGLLTSGTLHRYIDELSITSVLFKPPRRPLRPVTHRVCCPGR